MRKILILLVATLSWLEFSAQEQLPDGFVYLDEVIPGLVQEMRYAGNNNFIGRPIPGYRDNRAILSKQAAVALQRLQEELIQKDYLLKIFDAYRPQRAVNEFVEWARNTGDTLKKQEFYPEVDKANLFQSGYIASRSGHTRGSTVDLTLIDAVSCEELDMGGSYDFFGRRSHHDFKGLSREQLQNRQLLKSLMMKYGFRPYPEEWWHYTLRNEPYPDTYFDFPVE